MVVSTGSERSRNNDSSSINSLPHISFVDSSCNFLDQNGSKSFGSQFFVDAKEVDFSHFNFLFAFEHNVNGNSGDKSD